MFGNIVEIVSALYLLWMGIIMQVENHFSALMFKWLPAVLAIGLVVDVSFHFRV